MDHTSEQLQVVNKMTEVLAATTLKPYQTLIMATANTATDSYTITLPPVAQCAGRVFSIYATIANSKTITIAHHGDSANWSNVALTVTADRLVVYSDGYGWITLVDVST